MSKNHAEREDDGRVIVNQDKFDRIKLFFESGRTDAEWVKSFKLTNKEKAAILKDPRFIDIFDAKLLDFFMGTVKLDRGLMDLSRLIMQRLALLQKPPAGSGKPTHIVIGIPKQAVIEVEKG